MKYLEILRAKLATLTDERSAALAEMEAVTDAAVAEERSALTTEEDAAFAESRDKVDALDVEIAAVQERVAELEALDARREAAKDAPIETFQYRKATPDADDVDPRRMSVGEARDAALATIERKDSTRLGSDQLDKVERLIRSNSAECSGDSIARRVLLTETDAYRSAWQKAVTSPVPAFTPEESHALSEYRAMSIGTDTSGGFGVPVMIDPSIILTDQGSANPFRSIATVKTITNDEWKGVSSAGVSWSFDAEAAAVSDDTPTLAQPAIPAHMARGFIPFSIEVGADYPGFAQEMARLLAEGADELEASAFATGSGSDAPTGIITALDANTNAEVSVTTAGSLGVVDVRAIWSALPNRARANATWVMSEDLNDDISAFGSTYGADSTVDLTGEVTTLKSRPVVISSYFPDSTSATTAANWLAVGDFSKFYIVDRVGMSIELVPHLFADAAGSRPTGQRGWFAYKRVGSDSVDDTAFRLLTNT